jgi:adenylate cyclase
VSPERNAHSFLFADLVGYTAFTVARGDESGAELAVRFGLTVRALAGEHGLEFVKAMGDAAMVHGRDAVQIVRLGLRLAHDGPAPAWRPPVRIGVHTGPAIAAEGDWFGTTVNVAARVAASARGGELLLTGDACRELRSEAGLDLVDQGRRRLRGVPAPVRVYAARRTAPVPSRARRRGPSFRTHIDPVPTGGAA